MENAKVTNQSSMSAVVDGVFTVPGNGAVDFQPVLEILHASKYDAWTVIEAEQDSDVHNPLTYMAMGCTNLTQMVRNPGIKFYGLSLRQRFDQPADTVFYRHFRLPAQHVKSFCIYIMKTGTRFKPHSAVFLNIFGL